MGAAHAESLGEAGAWPQLPKPWDPRRGWWEKPGAFQPLGFCPALCLSIVSPRVSLCLCFPPTLSLYCSPILLVHTLRQVRTTYWAPGPVQGTPCPPRHLPGDRCVYPHCADGETEAGHHPVTRPHRLGPPALGAGGRTRAGRLRPRDGRWLTRGHTAVSRRPRPGASSPGTLPGSREIT